MSKLISIDELYKDVELSEKQNELNFLLNQHPDKSWVKSNAYANGAKYISIDRVEWLLRRVFKHYKIEVREIQQMFNGVSCTVRVHYKDPVSNDWLFHDGVGAAQIQTKRGTSPTDLININNNAIQLVVPIAKAEAVKNACKNFGRLFGSDLNRKSNTNYDDLLEFSPRHPNWRNAVKAVQSGNYTTEQVNEKYNFTENNLKLFEDELEIQD